MLLLVASNHAVNPGHFNVVEMAAIAAAATLFVYGAMGLISVLVEGRELQPGNLLHLTGSLSVSIACDLVAPRRYRRRAGVLPTIGASRLSGSSPDLAASMAALFVAYKEGFLGEELVHCRDDGVPR